ncbi:MAG: tripartite tricarboxylate transporter substrate-binding protein, partial [Pseudomonadota bacterium]
SPGSGTPPHLAGELLNAMAGIKIVHVPYKGAAPAVTDLLGGQVPLGIVALPAAMPHVKSGRLNALGVTSAKRSIFAPDVPTIAESGLLGYEVENWQGVLVPAGTPKEIVDKLNGEMVKILQMPEVKDRLYSQGFEILTSTPEQFGAYLRTEIVKWARLVKSSGASVD